MSRSLLDVPITANLPDRLAAELLERLPQASAGDLGDALVLLPSARVCRAVAECLLERSGRDALLLPRLLTDAQWADEAAAGLGLDDDGLPDDRVRILLLSHALQGADWLEGGDAAAPGLAESFVAFFDEVRRHGLDSRVLAGGDSGPLVELARTAEAETVAAEVGRIRQVWRLYRNVVPRDRVDRLVATVAGLERGEGLPDDRPGLAMVAGFGRVDPLRARLLGAALDHGRDHLLALPVADGPLAQRLLATWGVEERSTDPLAATRRLAAQLAGIPEGEPAPDPPLAERLEGCGAGADDLDHAGLDVLAAENPEDEARAVAGRVAAWLETHGAPLRGVTVATADIRLAARITARLRDAGLDADNTVGEPLAAQPAGLLLRYVLRAALTGLRAEPLLEVLGHPYTRIGDSAGAAGVWSLRLERMFRRETGPQSGLAGLHRRARERDDAVVALFRRQAPGMEAFVASLAEAFAPLLDCADGRVHAWSDLLDAVEAVWGAVAPERPLAEFRDQPDLTAVARLLDGLRTHAADLPAMPLAAFTAAVGRLLTAESVVPHRPRNIPVQVTGLVEARLARSDLLVLAGMNAGVFPGTAGSPVVLPGRVRRLLGLPTWREARARDAELFLRLVHGADRVVLTWSRRREGQPALVSPLVERLQLALGGGEPEAADGTTWRRSEMPQDVVIADQAAFAAEPSAIARYVETRPFLELSWSALRLWRDCPYRALLERGYALRAEEEVRDEFGRREYGSVVHALMCEVLAADHPVRAALAAGDAEAAAAALGDAARAHFLSGARELPERRLWCDAFARLVPAIVDVEMARSARWRPVAREARFALGLADLHAWLVARGGDSGPLPGHAVSVVIRGAVDRVDRDDAGNHAVVDYKTGQPPTFKAVREGEDLQLPLYALAVRLGAVDGVADGAASLEAFYYGLDDGSVGPVLQKDGQAPLRDEDDLLRDRAADLVDLAVRASDPGAAFPLLPRHVAGDATGELPCRWCDQRGVCRVEERTLTPGIAAKLDAIVNRREVGR